MTKYEAKPSLVDGPALRNIEVIQGLMSLISLGVVDQKKSNGRPRAILKVVVTGT
jgi:hypothetical protein